MLGVPEGAAEDALKSAYDVATLKLQAGLRNDEPAAVHQKVAIRKRREYEAQNPRDAPRQIRIVR